MIRYTLVCEDGHGFESWFPSSESFDDQAARGLVTCPACGSTHVSKGMMAPAIARGERAVMRVAEAASAEPVMTPEPEPVPMLTEPEQRVRALLRAVRDHVVRTADDVGTRFPEEARRMHYGEEPVRAIYGEASGAEARALIEEGIDVAPLPPMPDDRH